MRLSGVSLLAGAASSAAAAAVSPAGKHYTLTTQFFTVTTVIPTTIIPGPTMESKDAASDPETMAETETELAQPTNRPTTGGYITIGCGCSYKYPTGYVECPFSGSSAPSGFCSSETITKTYANAARPTTSTDDVSTTLATEMNAAEINPTSVLSSLVSEASQWPSGVYPFMAPQSTSPPERNCVTSLDVTFKLAQKINTSAPVNAKIETPAMPDELSLINGTLINGLGRIGGTVANGQFQFDFPPQEGTLFTAGWSACVDRIRIDLKDNEPDTYRLGQVLAFGNSTVLYACNSGDFSDYYYKPIDGQCSPIELSIVMEPEPEPGEGSLDFATLPDSDAPEGCNTSPSHSPFYIKVVGVGELESNGTVETLPNGDSTIGDVKTPLLLLSKFLVDPVGVMKDSDGRTATFDETQKLRFEYDVSNELLWSACEDSLLAFGEARGFWECGTETFRAIYSANVDQSCVQVKLSIEYVSTYAQLPPRPSMPAAPVISVPVTPLGRQLTEMNPARSFTGPVPVSSAITAPALFDRGAGLLNDQLENLNYLLTTRTITLPAGTGVDPSDDGVPETTWTLPATTIVITESPAPTKVLNARGADSVTVAPELSKALALRQDHDAIWTLNELISTLLSAKSALAYYSWLGESISLELHESTAKFVETACATVDGFSSCSTESLSFATQNSPAAPLARAEASATGNMIWDTAGTTGPTKVIAPTTTTSSSSSEYHTTISVVTKTITTSETITRSDTTFTSTFTTIDICTEYIGGKCIQKRQWPSLITTVVTRSNDHTTITTTQECRAWQGTCIDVHSLPPRTIEARQEGNPCPDLGCTAYTTLTLDYPLSTYTFPGYHTTRTTTIPAYTTTDTWYTEPGMDDLKRQMDETSTITTSVPIATVTQLVTRSSSVPAPSNDTTCTSSTTSVVCSASLCSHVNATATSVSYHWNGTLTSMSSTTVLPVTANNSTSKTLSFSTASNMFTSLVNATFSQTSASSGPTPQSTTADVGGITNESDGGKQVVLATIGMAFFAVLAFCL